jgi:hypothetical protein
MWSSHAPTVSGVRVTPNLYTTLDELDSFCDAVERAVQQGIPVTG